MQTIITTAGRVTTDLLLETSRNGKNTAYIQFSLAVTKGTGVHVHTNFFQCILYGVPAVRMAEAGVKKGSLISITGDLDLVEYARKGSGAKCISPKVTLRDWQFFPADDRGKDAPAATDSNDNFIQVCCDGDDSPFTCPE